jgi:DNA-binding CsgD family transcriptional regulator
MPCSSDPMAAAGIRPISGVLFSVDDAAYIGKVIDHIEASGRRRGAPLSARLALIRQQIAAAVMGVHADASARVPEVAQLIALTSEACIGTAEAAEILGMSADSVRWHCRNGNLDGRRMGRQVVITAESIEALKARRAEKQDRSA